jgi:hypothetical protein
MGHLRSADSTLSDSARRNLLSHALPANVATRGMLKFASEVVAFCCRSGETLANDSPMRLRRIGSTGLAFAPRK